MAFEARLRDLLLPVGIRFEPNPIIHRVAETLLAAQVPVRRQHRDMPKKKAPVHRWPDDKDGRKSDDYAGLGISRRTCAKLCHVSGGELQQIQFLLGHASVLTTERYLGCKQNLEQPVNDRFGPLVDWKQLEMS